jgi:EmrB/QacA subfamily drug resistance transporter
MQFTVRKPLGRNLSPYLILTITCTGIFIASLDQTVIYGALADMMPDLRLTVLDLDQAAWIVIGYLIGYTFAMPLMARISDVYGHSQIYILSLLIFIIGSIFVALSPNFEWIVAARIIQAIGGGAMVPIAMAIVADIFPKGSRAIPLGIIGGVVEAGGAFGPFYGGVISEMLDWRWIFWINIPIGIIAALLIFFLLGLSQKAHGKADYLGGILLATGLTFLSLALSQRPEQFDSPLYTLTTAIISVLCFTFFIMRQFRTTEPLINLSIFKNITFSSANITSLIAGAALIMALVNVPLISQTIMGSSAIEAGLRLFRLTIMICVGAVGGGFLCRKFGYRLPTIIGLLLSALGFFFLSRWPLDIADPQMTLHLVTVGLGFGLVIAPLATAVVDSIGVEQRAIGSSVVVMTRMMGMIVGLAALSSWGMDSFQVMTAGMSLEQIINTPEEVVQVTLVLFHDFFTVSMFICLAGIIPALWIRIKKRSK